MMEKKIDDALYSWTLSRAKRYCKDVQDAEDLANETLYKALLHKDIFDNEKSLKSWLVAIMQNTYIKIYHHNMLVQFYSISYDSPSSFKASDTLDIHDVISVIRKCAIRSRSVECVLYHAKGYSYNEISEIMNIPKGTVMSRISYARKLIKEELCK